MGYKLRREVRTAIPPGILTAAERLLVLELADVCNDDTREGWPGAAKLAELTDLSERSIQETLNRIGRKWVELRVPLGERDGRTFYAYAGKRTTFRFPPLTARRGATDPGSSGATDPGPSEPNGATDPEGRCDGSVEVVRQIRGPSPQGTSLKSNPSSLSPRANGASGPAVPAQRTEREDEEASRTTENLNPIHRLLLDADCPAENLDDVQGELLARHEPRSPAWWRTVAKNGDLPDLVAEVLEALKPAVTPRQHADAHPFEQHPDSPACRRCDLPEANGRHRVGNQDGGYISPRCGTDRQPRRSTTSLRAERGLRAADELDREFGHGKYAPGAVNSPALENRRRPGQHVPYRDPEDISRYKTSKI